MRLSTMDAFKNLKSKDLATVDEKTLRRIQSVLLEILDDVITTCKLYGITYTLGGGSVLGAVAGGVIGHQFGGGRGKDVATVVGALGGGYAGNQIQGSLQESDTYTTTQQRCKTVYDKSEKMLGYDVTYKIGDQQGKIRMDRDPGTQIPLDSNGQLILNNKV